MLCACLGERRYQFLSLAHFLSAGVYQHPYDDGPEPSITQRAQWGNWATYYTGVQRLMSNLSAPQGGTMTLVGQKGGSMPHVPETWNFSLPIPASNSVTRATSLQLPGLMHSTPSPPLQGPPPSVSGPATTTVQLLFAYTRNPDDWANATTSTLQYVFSLPAATPVRLLVLNPGATKVIAPGDPTFVPRLDAVLVQGSTLADRQPDTRQVRVRSHAPAISGRNASTVGRGLRDACRPTGRQMQVAAAESRKVEQHPPGTALHMEQARQGGEYHGEGDVERLRPVLVFKRSTSGAWDGIGVQETATIVRHGWVGYDVRGVVRAAEEQGLQMHWRASDVHLLPIMYEQFNDLLLNLLCDPEG